MTSPLIFDDVAVEKCPTINDSMSFNRSNILPVTCDTFTLTRTRNTFALFLLFFQHSDRPSYWYNLSNNDADSLCELL